MHYIKRLPYFLVVALIVLSCKKDKEAASVKLTLPEEETLAIGEEMQLSVSEVSADLLTWSSSDPSIAVVSNTGLVTAYKTGVTNIMVSYQESTTICKINVVIGNYQNSWDYNFGEAEGNLSLLSAEGVLSANDGVAGHIHPILPAPLNSQIARAWTGNNNVSGWSLTNSGTTIGSGSRLLFKAPPTTSTSKFSILNINGTNLFSVGFDFKLQAGTAGTYKFALGRDVSTMRWVAEGNDKYAMPIVTNPVTATSFSNNTNFSPTAALPTFLILWWDITANGYTFSIQQKDKSLLAIDPVLNPEISFVNGGDYNMQIYANNSVSVKKYAKNGINYIVSVGASHIWINNVLLLKSAGDANFITSELDLNTNLNAFMFLGLNNTNNVAQIYFDDFKYANYITDINTLP